MPPVKLFITFKLLCVISLLFNASIANDVMDDLNQIEASPHYIKLDRTLNQDYQSVIGQIGQQHRNQLAQIQQKWLRYRSSHCTQSKACMARTTEIQIENLKVLLGKKIHLKNSPYITLQFDNDGEITQNSYEEARSILINYHESLLENLSKEDQQKYRRSYEIYNAYLFDYCDLLSQVTSESFLNCQIKGWMDYQYTTSITATDIIITPNLE